MSDTNLKSIDIVKVARDPKGIRKFLKKNKDIIDQNIYNDFLYISCSFNLKELTLILFDYNNKNLHFSNNAGFVKFCEEGKTELASLFFNDPYTDISNNNYEAYVAACKSGELDLIHLFLNCKDVDIHAQNHRPFIEICSNLYVNLQKIIKYYLKLPECNPSAQNNEALVNALYYQNQPVIDLLLSDKRVNPNPNSNVIYVKALKEAIKLCQIEGEDETELKLTKMLHFELTKYKFNTF